MTREFGTQMDKQGVWIDERVDKTVQPRK